MHRISKAQISNFRSCKDVKITLTDFTPLVGYNNAGKSNIIRALEWAVEEKVLQTNDFFDPTIPLSVECHVEGVTEEVLDKLGSHRSRIVKHVVNDMIRIRTIQKSPGGSKSDVKREIWMPSKNEWGNPQGIPAAIKALFPEVIRIKAMMDVSAELSNNKTSTTIGKLIKAIMDPIVEEQGKRIQDILSELDDLFGADGDKRSDALKNFDSKATNALKEFFPGFKAKLHAPAPGIKDIFKGGKLVFSENHDNGEKWRDLQYYGHGVLRAAQMAMIKMLAQVVGTQPVGKTLLLIDEPELYMHPQMIESLRLSLRKLSTQGYQIVFSTHSPQMIGREEVPDTIMVNKKNKNTSIRKTLKDCCNELEGCAKQVDSLTLDLNNSSQFLFCNKVAFIEGETERTLLPELIKLLTNTSLMESGTALVVLNGCSGLPKMRKVLEAIGISHRTIVDLDFAFTNGKHLQIWSDDDPLYLESLVVMKNIGKTSSFEMNKNGLFKKGDGKTAEQAYNAFATSKEGIPLVKKIIDRFRYYFIWIWPLGSIEYHLGIQKKGGDAIKEYWDKLLKEPVGDVVKDVPEITAALNWLLEREAPESIASARPVPSYPK